MYIRRQHRLFRYWLLGYLFILLTSLALVLFMSGLGDVMLGQVIFGDVGLLDRIDPLGIWTLSASIAIPTIAVTILLKIIAGHEAQL